MVCHHDESEALLWWYELLNSATKLGLLIRHHWTCCTRKKTRKERVKKAIFKVKVTESFISEWYLSRIFEITTVEPQGFPPGCFAFGIYTVLIELMCLPKKVAGLNGFDQLHCLQFPVNLYYLVHEGLLAHSPLCGDLLTRLIKCTWICRPRTALCHGGDITLHSWEMMSLPVLSKCAKTIECVFFVVGVPA